MQRLAHAGSFDQSAALPERRIKIGPPKRVLPRPESDLSRRHELSLDAANVATNRGQIGPALFREVVTR
jgi:hypothetical protein